MAGVTQYSLMLVGCGKMGSAMLEGWIEQGIDPTSVCVVEPFEASAANISKRFGVDVIANVDALPDGTAADVIILAVKPQMMDSVAPGFRQLAENGSLVVSIAAGKSIAYYEAALGADARIVRAMPNTPAAVWRGFTVLCANDQVDDSAKARTSELVSAVGQFAWVDDEALIDAVTALSGGGPAYVFLLVESLAQAGKMAGLPSDLAETLARATVAGSGALLDSSEDAPATLRKNVTSPGGTTAEALRILMGEGDAKGWQSLIDQAILAATKRSQELAG